MRLGQMTRQHQKFRNYSLIFVNFDCKISCRLNRNHFTNSMLCKCVSMCVYNALMFHCLMLLFLSLFSVSLTWIFVLFTQRARTDFLQQIDDYDFRLGPMIVPDTDLIQMCVCVCKIQPDGLCKQAGNYGIKRQYALQLLSVKVSTSIN